MVKDSHIQLTTGTFTMRMAWFVQKECTMMRVVTSILMMLVMKIVSMILLLTSVLNLKILISCIYKIQCTVDIADEEMDVSDSDSVMSFKSSISDGEEIWDILDSEEEEEGLARNQSSYN